MIAHELDGLSEHGATVFKCFGNSNSSVQSSNTRPPDPGSAEELGTIDDKEEHTSRKYLGSSEMHTILLLYNPFDS